MTYFIAEKPDRSRSSRSKGCVFYKTTVSLVGINLRGWSRAFELISLASYLLLSDMLLWQCLALFLLVTAHACKAHKCHKFTDLTPGHAFLGTRVRVKLLLYTRHDDTCGDLLSHNDLTQHPQFNMSKPTTFIVHGYRPSGSPPIWLNITKKILDREDLNVIMVDWNYGATNLDYFKVVKYTYRVADNITAFIKMMQNHGASLSSIHMIGVSLGAHISGFVGAKLNGELGRITGLDAAGPGFNGKGLEDRLDPTDAQFVDVLHTDIDFLGYREPLGHIDFYANGGTDQPGCPKTILSGTSYFKCDHQRSVRLFLDTVTGKCSTRAFPCSSYKDFLAGKCLNCDHFGDAGCPSFGTSYKVDVMIWNKSERWGYITIKLYGDDDKEAVATIDHKASQFSKYTETELLAQFDRDVQQVKKVSMLFSTGKVLQPKRTLRILRVRLTHLEHKKPLCRYDVLLKENEDVTFRPYPCEESQF
ncbi:lipase member H-like isoform X2 [Kryptolebias marmoratus]|nr:lipase member H-like isoform X2 [Kryptolebias marmoratus]